MGLRAVDILVIVVLHWQIDFWSKKLLSWKIGGLSHA